MTYHGGASSLAPLQGDGWFSFSVPGGAAGVYVGLVDSDTTIDPSEQTHSLHFSGSSVKVIENGAVIRPSMPHSPTAVYAIVRSGDRVFYCEGGAGAPVTDPRIPFPIPGAVIYASLQPVYGPVYLDATLTAGGDSVLNAALHEEPMHSEARLSFAPLVLAASTDDVNAARVSFEPMTADASVGDGARIAFLPVEVYARQDADYNVASASFAPMTLFATSDYEARVGAALYLDYFTVSAGGPGTILADAHVAFDPLTARAGDYEYNDARMAFEPLTASAAGRYPAGPEFAVTVPAFSGELVSATVFDLLGGEGVGSDTLYPNSYALLEDEAVGEDWQDGGTATQFDVQTDAIGDDVFAYMQVAVLIEDEAVGDDLLTAEASALLVSDAVADDLLSPATSTTTDLLLDVAVGDDVAMPYVSFDVLDQEAVGDDAMVLVSMALLTDDAVGDDTVLEGVSSVVLLDDVAVADDSLSVQVVGVALVSGEASELYASSDAVGDDATFTKDSGLTAWVMNAKTGAVSWYDNWAFNSMTTVGGKVFAAGPDGLSVLGGDTDGADTIDARIDYGWQEFGGYDQEGMPKALDVKKRVLGLWFGYHSDGPMDATVETYGQGYGPYTYSMAPRSADQPRNNRITPGKGLNARYWRVSVANTGGCNFELHSINAETANSTRRL